MILHFNKKYAHYIIMNGDQLADARELRTRIGREFKAPSGSATTLPLKPIRPTKPIKPVKKKSINRKALPIRVGKASKATKTGKAGKASKATKAGKASKATRAGKASKGGIVEIYLCPHCGKKYKTTRGLNNHVQQCIV
jgi:hypothetical protein